MNTGTLQALLSFLIVANSFAAGNRTITIGIEKYDDIFFGSNDWHEKMAFNQAITNFQREINDTQVTVVERKNSVDVCPTKSNDYKETDVIIGYSKFNQNKLVVKMFLPAHCRQCLEIMIPGDIMVSVIRYIVEELNLNSVAILYDNTFEIGSKYATLLTNLPTRQIIMEIHPRNRETQLKQLKSVDLANYFLAADSANISKTLKVAEAQKLFTRNFAWYIITKDIDTSGIDSLISSVIVISPDNFLKDISNNFTSIDDMFVYNVTKFGLYEAYNVQLPNPDSCNEAKNLSANYSQEFKEDTSRFLYANFRLKIQMISSNSKSIGYWNNEESAPLVYNNETMSNFLPEKQYRIVTTEQPPFVYRIKNEDGTVSYQGYCIDLINELKNVLHFTYEIYDLHFNDTDDNETHYSGSQKMLNELKEKRADIVLAPLYSNMEDNKVEFTIPFYDLIGIKMLMKKSVIETSLFRFLTVMEPWVWASIVAAILLWIIDRFSPFSYQNNQEKDDQEKRIFTLKESFWFCVTSLTPQGSGDAPKSVSGRLIAATWWLFGFVFIASYTANLAAFLTVARLENPINSLESLANQYVVKYSVVQNSSTMKYFEKMAKIEDDFFEKWKDMTVGSQKSDDREKYSVWNYPVGNKYSQILSSMSETGFQPSLKSGIQKIKNTKQGFILLADTIDIDNALLNNCDLTTAEEEFSRRPTGLAVQHGSILKEQLSMGILKLQNARTLEILKEKWWNNNPYKIECPEIDKHTEGISLKNIGGIFFVIFAGIIISWVILGFEYLWCKCLSARVCKQFSKVKFFNKQHSVICPKDSENTSNKLRNRFPKTLQKNSQEKIYFYTIKSNNYLN